MKKILALLLAVAIVMTMSIPAFAEEIDETVTDHSGSKTGVNTSAEIGVYGNYLAELESDKVLSVIVSWTDMYFQYAKSQQGTWDPVTHTYTGADDQAKWLKDTATITLENHSNTAITANLAFQKASSDSNVTGQFDEDEVELATAVGTDKDNAPSDDVVFTIGGSISDGETELGTISVSLDANQSDSDSGDDTDNGDNGDNGNNGGGEEDTTNYLDLSGKALTEWSTLIAAYLDEHPGELTIKLGTNSIDYVGDANGSVDDANMPAHVLNNAVYSYNGNSYDNKVALTLVDVKEIGDKAFMYAASAFSSISAPNATSIGSQAFQGNQATKTFNFPNVTSIGSSAFAHCGAMESITFGKPITSIGSAVFGSNSDNDLMGKDCHPENVTITLNANQGDYLSWYTTSWGENGKFASYTWKNVVKG